MPFSLTPIRQLAPNHAIADLRAEVARQWSHLAPRIQPGMRVAITAGSRGIAGIATILSALVAELKAQGAEPFLVAAMGSHGGSTVAGQEEVLRHLGITPEAVGCPWQITDQAIKVGTTADGHVAWCDAAAASADAILLVNRVKPHTSFQGAIGSGLMKMLSVGLGKVPGATQVHKLGPGDMQSAIRSMAALSMTKLPVVGGLAILENAFEHTARLVPLLAAEIDAAEPGLLQEAQAMMPGLPVPKLDILIVEEMGKNYSGTGMDTNVIGRWRAPGVPEPTEPAIGRIVVLRLSTASTGNANGIGLADVVTRRLVEAVDWDATYLNVITTGFIARAFIPMVCSTERMAIERAVASLTDRQPPLRVIRVRNTLHLDQMWVSAPVLDDLRALGTLGASAEIVRPEEPLAFDASGNLLPAG